MKNLTLSISLLLLSFTAHAENCKVSGISDSPQTISCRYQDGWSHHMKLLIHCVDGSYQFSETANGSPAGGGAIVSTYHEDVQSGTCPLFFKLEDTRTIRITKVLGPFFRGVFVNPDGSDGRNGHLNCSVH